MESTAEVNTRVNKALVNSPLLHQRDLHWYPGNQPLVAGGSRARANSITTRAIRQTRPPQSRGDSANWVYSDLQNHHRGTIRIPGCGWRHHRRGGVAALHVFSVNQGNVNETTHDSRKATQRTTPPGAAARQDGAPRREKSSSARGLSGGGARRELRTSSTNTDGSVMFIETLGFM